jgi:hypothetical protein
MLWLKTTVFGPKTALFRVRTLKIHLVKEGQRLLNAIMQSNRVRTNTMTNEFQHQLLIQTLRNSSLAEYDEELNHIEYVAKHEYDIKRTGRVLAFLGLAEENKQAPFGWTPTLGFFSIIAKRGTRHLKQSNKARTADESIIANLICEVARGEGEYSNAVAEALLSALGLFRADDDCKWKPTPLLRKLYLKWFECNEG